MVDGKKLILGVGDFYIIKNLGDSFEDDKANKIVLEKRVSNVTDAINKINSRNYQGVLLSSLTVRGGTEAEKYNEAAKKFEKFDNSPYNFSSGGLYVVKQACNEGLVVAVNVVAENLDALKEAERLGAKYFDKDKNFNDIPKKILKYFQSRL